MEKDPCNVENIMFKMNKISECFDELFKENNCSRTRWNLSALIIPKSVTKAREGFRL